MMEFIKKKKESTELVANFHLALVANAKNPCKLSAYKGFSGPDGKCLTSSVDPSPAGGYPA
jgi:hypothetical protein